MHCQPQPKALKILPMYLKENSECQKFGVRGKKQQQKNLVRTVILVFLVNATPHQWITFHKRLLLQGHYTCK